MYVWKNFFMSESLEIKLGFKQFIVHLTCKEETNVFSMFIYIFLDRRVQTVLLNRLVQIMCKQLSN